MEEAKDWLSLKADGSKGGENTDPESENDV